MIKKAARALPETAKHTGCLTACGRLSKDIGESSKKSSHRVIAWQVPLLFSRSPLSSTAREKLPSTALWSILLQRWKVATQKSKKKVWMVMFRENYILHLSVGRVGRLWSWVPTVPCWFKSTFDFYYSTIQFGMIQHNLGASLPHSWTED